MTVSGKSEYNIPPASINSNSITSIIKGIYPRAEPWTPRCRACCAAETARYLPYDAYTRSVMSRKRDATLASFDNKDKKETAKIIAREYKYK